MSAEWIASLTSGGIAALPLALVGGVLVGLNPCCLALYPAVAGTCYATGLVDRSRSVASNAVAFIAGTALATTAMGMLAALAGHAVVGLGAWPRYALAAVPLVMGTHLLGWLTLPLPKGTPWKGGGLAAAFAAGLLLTVVVGSCGTPVLAAILSFAAYKGNLVFGALLLFLYGVGYGLPLLLVGTAAGGLARRPAWHAWSERASGAALISLGYYLILTVR